MSRFLLLLLMLCVCLPAAAREVRLQGANGDGGTCPEAAAEAAVQPAAKGKRESLAAPVKAKPTTFRGDDASTMRPPRWHSFVPGMFR